MTDSWCSVTSDSQKATKVKDTFVPKPKWDRNIDIYRFVWDLWESYDEPGVSAGPVPFVLNYNTKEDILYLLSVKYTPTGKLLLIKSLRSYIEQQL